MVANISSIVGNFSDNQYYAGLPRNIYDTLHDSYVNTALAAGTYNLVCFTVPDGEIWNVKQIVFNYTGTVPTLIWLNVYVNPTNFYFYTQTGFVSGRGYNVDTDLYLKPGEILAAYISAATLNDDFAMWINGYKIGLVK